MQKLIIVGGGVIGLLTAYYLSKYKKLDITIIDKSLCSKEASNAGGGIISPLYPWRHNAKLASLSIVSQTCYPKLCSHLLAETSIDPQYQVRGLLITGSREIYPALNWSQHHNQDVSYIGGKSISQLQPHLNKNLNEALHLPQVANLNNPNLLAALRKFLPLRGVRFFENTKVKSLVKKSGLVQEVVTTKGNFKADYFLLATGAWTNDLLRLPSIKIYPVKGQMLALKPKDNILKKIVLAKNNYLIPRQDGTVVVGSTCENVGFNKELTNKAYDDLLKAAIDIMPDLAFAPVVDHWCGLRPAIDATEPYIGKVNEYDNLWLSAGHFRTGLTLAPASALLIRDQILLKLRSKEALVAPL